MATHLPHEPRDRLQRIAIVAPALEQRGGLAAVALFLHRILQESGRYESSLISLAMSSRDENSFRYLAPWTWRDRPRITPARLEHLSYRLVGSRGAEWEPNRYRPRPALTRLLQSFDLVQIVAGTPAVAHVARDTRRPVVLQCATMVSVERRALLRQSGVISWWRRLTTWLVSRMDESGLRIPDMTLVENAWMLERVTRTVGSDHVRFSPPGVDTEVFRPPNGDRPATPIILTVGRLDDPRKNIKLLVDAFAIARAQQPELRLLLAGQRPPDDSVMHRARMLGVAGAIDVKLSLSTAELAALYRSATVFALSSDEEGLGIAALEAMASGLPVVCTRCGGPETSVRDGETGFLVPVGDANALGASITRVLEDAALRKRMGRAAREHVERHFSLERTGREFLRVYDELLQEPARVVAR